MSEQTIYISLVTAGMTPQGAAGLMGNMMAESAMRANNSQDSYGWSDEDYTAAVDNGTYGHFVRDAIGYGLCQWTSHTRKAALLAFAVERGASIGDEAMQTDFAVRELRSDYAELWAYLCRTDDWYEAAERVCREYERPAVCNVAARAGYAKEYFETYNGMEVSGEQEPAPAPIKAKWTADMPPMATLCEGFGGGQVLVLQKLLAAAGYTVEIGGLFDADTAAVVKQYQSNNGLAADGVVGKQTWMALFAG